MSFLNDILGGDAAKQVGQLVEQFESGNAHEVSPQDAAAHHDAVAQNLSPQDYEQAAVEAMNKLSPEQRKEVAEKLTEAAKTAGREVQAPAAKPGGAEAPSADSLGKLMSQLETSGGITSLAGDLLGNPTVRSALVGVAGTAAKKLL